MEKTLMVLKVTMNTLDCTLSPLGWWALTWRPPGESSELDNIGTADPTQPRAEGILKMGSSNWVSRVGFKSAHLLQLYLYLSGLSFDQLMVVQGSVWASHSLRVGYPNLRWFAAASSFLTHPSHPWLVPSFSPPRFLFLAFWGDYVPSQLSPLPFSLLLAIPASPPEYIKPSFVFISFSSLLCLFLLHLFFEFLTNFLSNSALLLVWLAGWLTGASWKSLSNAMVFGHQPQLPTPSLLASTWSQGITILYSFGSLGMTKSYIQWCVKPSGYHGKTGPE